METSKLKKFAQFARRSLMEQVSSKLKLVLAEGSASRRENTAAVKQLEDQLKLYTPEQLIEKVAYIWFNRFCALRFMDVNRYTRIGVVSPSLGQFQPEILAEAKMGHVDEEMVAEKTKQHVLALLSGSAPSSDPQAEGYRLLVVAVCNHYHKVMPYLFEQITDFTELLMPDDLLSGSSILAFTREALTPDVCEDVEVIGWLYQFYISEKKDSVFDGLKKNNKIAPEDIPAATQLFTPHWIVRYLVENSLGRLWMLNHPQSRLVEKMNYFIKEDNAKINFLRINKPEELKICDPACGSGHMLVYAFDLLYSIYEEEGYESTVIPEKILTCNLFGIEIDERSGEMAAFALTMKARAKQRRFFRKPIRPNICVLENIRFDANELSSYMDFIGRNLFTNGLITTLRKFEEADNFGSLIRPEVFDIDGILKILKAKDVSSQLFLNLTHQKVLRSIQQTEYLIPKYHIVVTNPPYMGSKGMNMALGDWAKVNYPITKSDLFAMFIERSLDLAQKKGFVAMITMQSWMFLSSFEKLRDRILDQNTILQMAHLGTRAFDSIGGEVVATVAFVLNNSNHPEYRGGYLRLVDGNSEAEKEASMIECVNYEDCRWFYRACSADFRKIPGNPIAYWASDALRHIFEISPMLNKQVLARQGMATGDNDRFVRNWWEVSFSSIMFGAQNKNDAFARSGRWFPYNKGGEFRRWYGNRGFIICFSEPDYNVLKNMGNHCPSEELYFRSSISWSRIGTGINSFREYEQGFLFDQSGHSIFSKDPDKLRHLLLALNNKFYSRIGFYINPTINLEVGNIGIVPYPNERSTMKDVDRQLISLSKADWDSYETSWDFLSFSLLEKKYHQPTLNDSYSLLRARWLEMTLEMQRLEEENNRIFIDFYTLKSELTPDVPIREITLTCNPYYRYNDEKSPSELERSLLTDTIKEFISYAVGCMFGRYSLETPGLILCNQCETIKDYMKKIPEPVFSPDFDNVIPILEGDWFTDDITERFRKFLRITFGEDHFEENLRFIEEALGKDLRKYFIKDFYNDHIRRYKKRPIYWLFSSPMGSFNALIYLHRYRPDTVSIVLNSYLRELRTKLTTRKNHLESLSISGSSSQSDKTTAIKEIVSLQKILIEIGDYESDVLYPLATERVEINFDDGVKVNYLKFGAALKKISGLDSNED